MTSKTHEPYPNERAGLRYRRILGESLTRALMRFVDANKDTPIGDVQVALSTRDGTPLATLPLVKVMQALQFNFHIVNSTPIEEASEAVIVVDGGFGTKGGV